MKIYTHGKKKGLIELLANERRALETAHSLLCDIEAHGNAEVMEVAAAASNGISAVLDKLAQKEPVTNG